MRRLSTPSISVVAAVALNGVIGSSGSLPWRLPADLERFRSLTLGKPVIMGRKTFLSIGKPLDGRTNIIISSSLSTPPPGCMLARSLYEAVRLIPDRPEYMVIGGRELFREALVVASCIHLTRVMAEVKGDEKFPEIDMATWRVISREFRKADEFNEYAVEFLELRRRSVVGHSSRLRSSIKV